MGFGGWWVFGCFGFAFLLRKKQKGCLVTAADPHSKQSCSLKSTPVFSATKNPEDLLVVRLLFRICQCVLLYAQFWLHTTQGVDLPAK